jgi:SAM-dependent methyltransferase
MSRTTLACTPGYSGQVRWPRAGYKIASGGTATSFAEFSGAIPRHYDECLGPVMFEPYAADLARRVPPHGATRVLELACGTGVVTRRLRTALPESATLVATDLSEEMVSYAREAVPLAGIAWCTADAQALPFADESFDVVVCQFGIMFLPEAARGFGEADRVLAPGGRLLANTWLGLDENPAHRAVHEACRGMFPDNPPRFLETPYGYHDPERLRADAAAGGFAEVQLDTVRLRTRGPSALEFARGMVRGTPLCRQLTERGADLETATREVARAVARVGGSAPFTLDLAATVVTAMRGARRARS